MRRNDDFAHHRIVVFCVLCGVATLVWHPWRRPHSVLADGRPAAATAPAQLMPVSRTTTSPSHVLVVLNAESSDSRAIAERYLDARHIPVANVLRIACSETDEWPVAEYQTKLETFVQARARANPAIDYVVLTRGIPFRFSNFGADGGFSTDSVLSTCTLTPRPNAHCANPYYRAKESFTRAKYGILLVTRLDGPTRQSGFREIESSLNARPLRGPFYLRDSFVESMEPAYSVLSARGMTTEWVRGTNNSEYPHNEGKGGPFMAHWGAGPHDSEFTSAKFALMKFLPGAICDITWSASAAGLRDSKSNGNIAVMTDNGAAGAQGYVSEPYADALSKAEIVLDRYTSGYNLAESFSMATPFLNWKQVVLGDPLCAPYAKPDDAVKAH